MKRADDLGDLLQPLDEEHDRVVDRDDRLDERAGRVEHRQRAW